MYTCIHLYLYIYLHQHIIHTQVTGESAPVRKMAGDMVISGSIVRDASLEFDATRVGKDSFINQLVVLVEKAQVGFFFRFFFP